MTARESAIFLLVRLYPAAWRREFGIEFEDLLHSSPLSVPVTVNVIASALGERVMDLLRRAMKGGDMPNQTFGAGYDGLTRVISGGAVLLLIAIPLIAMRAGAVAVFLAVASVIVITLTYAFSPRDFEICDGALRVKRLVGAVVFPLANLRFMRIATPVDFRGCVRLWGSGGLFGYYGWFWSKALGKSRWYVTDRSKALVVADGHRIILVSPEDREGFIAAIGHADAGAPKQASGLLPANSERASSGVMGAGIVGATIGLASIGLVAAAMLYAPGRPPVDLTRDSLVIHSRLYGMTVPASSVDVANVRVVDLQLEPGWRPVSRTNGFGNPHYRAGNFRAANGRTVKLFTTGSERLVLLPPAREDGTPVLLDAADPDQFAARVRQEWSGQ